MSQAIQWQISYSCPVASADDGAQVEAVEAVLEQERKASNAKDARHKLTVERLRQKLVEVQVQTSCRHPFAPLYRNALAQLACKA